jgi:hypothetical protein
MGNDGDEPGLGPIRIIAWDALIGTVGGLVVAGLVLVAVSRGWFTSPIDTVSDFMATSLRPAEGYAVVYAVAGGVVGALTPYLRTARRMYAVYGFVGVCIATALVVINGRTWPSGMAGGDGMVYVIVAVAFGAAFAISRRRSLERTRGGASKG